MASSLQCGFIGLGIMGARMATRLVSGEVPLTVWNRGRDKITPLAAHGARAAADAADLARSVDCVFLCLSDTAAVESVTFGPNGLSDGLDAGKIVVDFSSIAPEATRTFARRLRETCGVSWIDAPVTGGPLAAERGALSILCGGEAADVSRVQPLLSNVASKVTHFGSVGAGQSAKLCNQVLAGSAMLACVESIVLAEHLGVDPALLIAAIDQGFASSPLTRLLLPRMAAREYEPPVGTTATILKDLRNILEAARHAGASLPLTEAVADVFSTAADADLGTREPSALVDVYPPGGRAERSSSM